MACVALVTGGARRLGAVISRALAGAGFYTVIHHGNSGAAADALAAEIGAAGGACGVLQADLTDRAAIATLLPRCTAAFGAPAVLINNASSYHYDSITTLDPAHWDANLRTNLEAPVALSGAFFSAGPPAPAAIVNMLDFKVTNLNPDYLSYTLAKVALAGATQMLAMAFHGRVRVNAIAPGLTMRSGKQTDEQFQRAWRMTPLGYGPSTDDIAAAVLYAVRTRSLNGQVLALDAGAGLLPRGRDISVDPEALNR